MFLTFTLCRSLSRNFATLLLDEEDDGDDGDDDDDDDDEEEEGDDGGWGFGALPVFLSFESHPKHVDAADVDLGTEDSDDDDDDDVEGESSQLLFGTNPRIILLISSYKVMTLMTTMVSLFVDLLSYVAQLTLTFIP